MKLITHTDGGARGNPGPAGIGGTIDDIHGKRVAEVSEYIGKTTNNQAEYQALLVTLNRARELGATEVDAYLDSELVVKQLNGQYKMRNAGLAPLFVQVHNVSVLIGKVRFTHVRREQNSAADALVNKAIDKALNA